MFTIHSMGGYEMMKGAVESSRYIAKQLSTPKPLMLAVTILTNMDEIILEEIGIKTPLEQQLVRLGILAKRAGVHGVIISPREIRFMRNHCGANFLILTPAVRAAFSAEGDQKRTLTSGEAIKGRGRLYRRGPPH